MRGLQENHTALKATGDSNLDGVCCSVGITAPPLCLLTGSRKVVSYDLTSPSMMTGTKGYDRLSYACQNVLDKPLTWLYCNAHPSSAPYLAPPDTSLAEC